MSDTKPYLERESILAHTQYAYTEYNMNNEYAALQLFATIDAVQCEVD